MNRTTDLSMTTTGTAVPMVTPRIWAYADRQGTAHPVVCPSWCENDHEMDQHLTTAREDIAHQAYGREAVVEATEAYEQYEARSLLRAELRVVPDSDVNAGERVPHVHVEVVDSLWSRPMDPDELAAFIGTVEGQLAELRSMHARLVEVRAEHGSAL